MVVATAEKVTTVNFSIHRAAGWKANEAYYQKRLMELESKEKANTLNPAEIQELLGLRSKHRTTL